MGLTTNDVAVSIDVSVASSDDDELPQAEARRMSEEARTRGRNVIETAYENFMRSSVTGLA